MDTKAKERYEKMFDTEAKVAAFDKIAEVYFNKNFGTMQKSDFDVLMFSIYIEQILEKYEDDLITYSDYTLSKELGITQSRVNILKQKKELKYPKEGFDWRTSFSKFVDKAVYSDEKIQIYVPDPNVYLEIKNAIESTGGIVDIKRNKSVLQISPCNFIELLIAICPDGDREKIKKDFVKKLKVSSKDNNELIEKIEKKPLGKALTDYAEENGLEIIFNALDVVLSPNKLSALKNMTKSVARLISKE